MRTSRLTDEQIVQVLAEGRRDGAVRDLCRRHGISERTYYRWQAHVRRPADLQRAAHRRALGGESMAHAPRGRPGARCAGPEGSAGTSMVTARRAPWCGASRLSKQWPPPS
jgi:putative transposase